MFIIVLVDHILVSCHITLDTVWSTILKLCHLICSNYVQSGSNLSYKVCLEYLF